MNLIDPESCFEFIEGGKLELLILCDHASNMLPQGYGRLGLAARLECPAMLRSTYALARGLAHVLVEIRQDPIGRKSGVDEWAGRLARVIEPIMNDAAIRRAERY